MLGHRPRFEKSPNQRLGIGLSYGSGIDLSGLGFGDNPMFGFPLLHGSLLVTSNLFINGTLSGFQTDKDVIQISGYGFDLILSDDAVNYWSASLSFSYLDGAQDLRCRTVDFGMRRIVLTQFMPIHYGIGVNLYSARILMESGGDIPNWIEGQINYLFFGSSWSISQCKVGAQINFHSDYILFSFDINTQFN